MISVLELALRSAMNATPVIYDSLLNSLRDALNSLAADEGQFLTFSGGASFELVVQIVRQLPGPPPRQVNQRYIDALDAAITQREVTLAGLQTEITQLEGRVTTAIAQLDKLALAVDSQQSKITADSATITQVVNSAADRLDAEWQNKLDSWDVERVAKDRDLDNSMTDHIQVMAGASVVGQRLVEHAAGLLTATNWSSRATRERRNAIWLRWGSITAFVTALATGFYILTNALGEGFNLTVGDGILRGALVLALAGVGTFLTREARRHFKEADSAEEIALALTAIEPFYEGAGEEERASARASVGDAVFVKNVLSRFSSRDAARHAGGSNQELSEIAELLTGAALTKLGIPPHK
jgi:hypothetical protein